MMDDWMNSGWGVVACFAGLAIAVFLLLKMLPGMDDDTILLVVYSALLGVLLYKRLE